MGDMVMKKEFSVKKIISGGGEGWGINELSAVSLNGDSQ